MRLHFQARPLDLYFSLMYTVGITGLVLALRWSDSNTFLSYLITPGYLLTAAIFPDNARIRWLRRALLSMGLSVSCLVVIGVLLKLTSYGAQATPVIVAITLVSVSTWAVAFQRRMNLPIETRLSATITTNLESFREASTISKAFSACVAVSLTLTVITLGYFLLVPTPAPQLTEFFILGPGGNASGYPTSLNISQPGSVILGIANHEATTVLYTMRIDLVGVRLVYNATSGFNEIVEVNRTTWSTINVTLADGANWTYSYTFSIPSAGLWKVQFLLFKDGELSSVYRNLRLFIQVK